MKELLKAMLVLALLFASTFIIIKTAGVFTLADIEDALEQIQRLHPGYLAVTVSGLLFADLFIAIPTMTVSILAGHFLGWPMGAMAVIIGFYAAGITAYAISYFYGWRLLNRIYKAPGKLEEMHQVFSAYGPAMLIVCRAMPILPEVSCCMAGATRMPFLKFLSMYSLGTVPYALITTYAGSISTVEQPTPAIMTAIIISLLLWSVWYFLGKRTGSSQR